jgi:hypothetical protein
LPLHPEFGFVSSFEHSSLIRHSGFGIRVSCNTSISSAALRKTVSIGANNTPGESILWNFYYGGRCAGDV